MLLTIFKEIKNLMKELIFLGTNSVLEQQIEICELIGQPIKGIIDSDWYGNRKTFASLPLLDSEDVFEKESNKYSDYVFFIGTNWNPLNLRDRNKRKKLIDIIRKHNLDCINLIHPQSYVSGYATLGKGIFIGANVSIEPDVSVGDFVQIWHNSTVGHHVTIGENTVLQRRTGVSAESVGKNCYISSGAGIPNHNVIGNNVVVAPGLLVIRDVKDNENVRIDKNSVRIYRNPSKSK